jgi:hypothetical protein
MIHSTNMQNINLKHLTLWATEKWKIQKVWKFELFTTLDPPFAKFLHSLEHKVFQTEFFLCW